jgi:hypothetical protein
MNSSPFLSLILYKQLQNQAMNQAFIIYLKDKQKKENRENNQYSFAVAQTAREGRELNESALVNSR